MTDTTTVMPAVLEDMDEDEGRRLIELERKVEQAMQSAGRIAGAALGEIRDRRLYRASHASFERYCLERHGLSKSTAQRMIAVASDSSGLPPGVSAIGEASARAAQRRHETLDQPPVELDPSPEELQEGAESDEEAPEEAESVYRPPVIPEPRLTPPVPPGLFSEADRWNNSRPAGVVATGAPPKAERSAKMRHRNDMNRLLAVLDNADLLGMASVSTSVERLQIAKLAAAMANVDRAAARRSSEAVEPKDCDHPSNRRIGSMCGKCGAIKKVKA